VDVLILGLLLGLWDQMLEMCGLGESVVQALYCSVAAIAKTI
jgi:hypothetical protein